MVTAVVMGYGHLRAAHALAEALGVELVRADRRPYSTASEQALWSLARWLYDGLSRASQGRLTGWLLRPALELLTRIGPPPGASDSTRPTAAARLLARLVGSGNDPGKGVGQAVGQAAGQGVVEAARRAGRPLLTTYFLPALAAQRSGYRPTYCLVTDTDLSRAWVPAAAAETVVTYLAPSGQAADRLRSYGVPAEQVVETGFPLPPALLGGPDLPTLRHHLAARLARLDPTGTFRAAHREEIEHDLGETVAPADRRPPLLTYAVGGAGAQAALARAILVDLAPAILQGRLRLGLVAGSRPALATRFTRWAERLGLGAALGEGGLTILAEGDVERYFARFHALLAETDVLWTKPSEMTFFAALGLPLLLAPPVGAQERANRRWALDAGVAFPRETASGTGRWLSRRLDDGTLAAAAWTGFRRLPADGVYRIRALIEGEEAAGPDRGADRDDAISRPRPERSAPAPSSPRASWS